jgi:hypothetical protein
MIRFPAMTLARGARVVGVLAVVPISVFAHGLSVVSPLAAVRHPVPVIAGPIRVPAAPVIISDRTNSARDTSPGRPPCFGVDAIGRTGRMGPVTECWRTGAAAQSFAVGGSLTMPLYPGTSQGLDLTFTNPGSAPITIPRGGVPARDITITSRARGCASSNFAVAQGLTSAVTIRARQFTPVSLAALRVPPGDWPVIEMIETGTNQDACRDAKLTLTYAGIEAGR